MKKHLTTFLLLISFFSYSQDLPCNCLVDLIYMNATVAVLPSYTNQMVGDKRIQYERRYNFLKAKAATTTDHFQCFLLTSKLLSYIKDNHLQLAQHPLIAVTNNPVNPLFILKEGQKIADYKQLGQTIKVNTDSLKKVLENKLPDNIEGIYSFNDSFKIGLYKTGMKDSLVGVVIESSLSYFEKGKIALVLYEKDKNIYSGVECFFFQNSFISFNAAKYSNGRLITHFPWTKFPERDQFIDLKHQDRESLILKDIERNIQYIRFGGYDWDEQKVKEAAQFNSNLKEKFSNQNTILDFRHANLENEEFAEQFLKFFKKFSEKDIYVIISSSTIGAAERFIVELKKQKRIILVGENTSGSLSYGMKNSRSIGLPCNHDSFYLVNADYSEYLEYEEMGIAPDIYLTMYSDWIQQTIDIIKRKNSN